MTRVRNPPHQFTASAPGVPVCACGLHEGHDVHLVGDFTIITVLDDGSHQYKAGLTSMVDVNRHLALKLLELVDQKRVFRRFVIVDPRGEISVRNAPAGLKACACKSLDTHEFSPDCPLHKHLAQPTPDVLPRDTRRRS